MTKTYKCDWCGNHFDGTSDYKLILRYELQDPRDGDPDTFFDLCFPCHTTLSKKLKNGKKGMKHNLEPNDTEGHCYTCLNCGEIFSIYNITEECKGEVKNEPI
jgi:hypothetical protein